MMALKMTLLGEKYVGKTMLINQYINKIFINENVNALPNDIKKKKLY
jgi:GTPase SAR1 family protein